MKWFPWWPWGKKIRSVSLTPNVIAPGQVLSVMVVLYRPAPAAGVKLLFEAIPANLVTFSSGGTLTVPAGSSHVVEQGIVTGNVRPQAIRVSTGGDSKTVKLF